MFCTIATKLRNAPRSYKNILPFSVTIFIKIIDSWDIIGRFYSKNIIVKTVKIRSKKPEFCQKPGEDQGWSKGSNCFLQKMKHRVERI